MRFGRLGISWGHNPDNSIKYKKIWTYPRLSECELVNSRFSSPERTDVPRWRGNCKHNFERYA